MSLGASGTKHRGHGATIVALVLMAIGFWIMFSFEAANTTTGGNSTAVNGVGGLIGIMMGIGLGGFFIFIGFVLLFFSAISRFFR